MRWGELVERLKMAAGLTDRQLSALEKRRSLRVSKGFGLVAQLADGENLPLLVKDCGSSGLRVESPHRLKKGDVLKLSNPKNRSEREDGGKHSPEARVVWVRKKRGLPTHEMGLSFIIESNTQRRLLASFLLDECKIGIRNPTEKRRAPRIGSLMRLNLEKTHGGQTFEGTVRDIAVGGVLAVLTEPLDRQDEVSLTVKLPGTSKPLSCNGRVLRCVSLGAQGYEVGIAFTSVPADHRERLITCLTLLLQHEEDD